MHLVQHHVQIVRTDRTPSENSEPRLQLALLADAHAGQTQIDVMKPPSYHTAHQPIYKRRRQRDHHVARRPLVEQVTGGSGRVDDGSERIACGGQRGDFALHLRRILAFSLRPESQTKAEQYN